MRNDRAREVRNLEREKQKAITWEGFCGWFDNLNELDKLNFRALVRLEGADYLSLAEEQWGREVCMVKFARGVLEKLGVFLV